MKNCMDASAQRACFLKPAETCGVRYVEMNLETSEPAGSDTLKCKQRPARAKPMLFFGGLVTAFVFTYCFKVLFMRPYNLV